MGAPKLEVGFSNLRRYAVVPAKARGPKSTKWYRAQWKRSFQTLCHDVRSAKLMARQSRPLFNAA
jgi:hypothetical protein